MRTPLEQPSACWRRAKWNTRYVTTHTTDSWNHHRSNLSFV